MTYPPPGPPVTLRSVTPPIPDRDVERFALDADVTVYWPWVRPCWEERRDARGSVLRASEHLAGPEAHP